MTNPLAGRSHWALLGIAGAHVRTDSVRPSSLAFAVVVVPLVPTPAAGENKSVHATASGDVAATDNVFATTADRNEGDLLFTIRPGIVFGYDAPRHQHDATLEGEMINYLAHSDAPSLSLRGSVRSSFVTSKHTNLNFNLGGSNGVITALSSRLSPEQTGPQLRPIGHVDNVNGDAGTQLSYESGRSYTLSIGGFARASRSNDNADDMGQSAPTIVTSAEAGGTAGFQRLEREAPADALLGPRLDRQVNPRLRASWQHDFNRIWSSSIDAGAVYVHPYKDDPNQPGSQLEDGIFPLFGAALAYTEVWGRAQVQVRRDMSPNLFVAQNTINDSGVISLAMPLPWLDDSRMRRPKFVGLGSFGINRTQLINSDTSLVDSSIWLGRVDAGIGYTPRPGFTYGVRYEFVYQSDSTGIDNMGMRVPVPGFFRNTISFTFSLRYPDRVAGADSRKKKSGGVRADGKDLVPIGVDPVTNPFDDGGGGEGGED
jgi:hypothetical protein